MACIRKWRGKWVVDWRDPSGKRFIETINGDREDAKKRLAEVLKTGEQGASKRQTLKEYGNWWLENVAEGEIKESTFQEYKSVLQNHVYPRIGAKPFVKVSREMIRELISSKKKQGFSQSTIRNIIAPVRGDVLPGDGGRGYTCEPRRKNRKTQQAEQRRAEKRN